MNKNLIILIAMIIGLSCILMLQKGNQSKTRIKDELLGKPLIKRTQNPSQITITSPDSNLNLIFNKDAKEWQVQEKHNYSADLKKIKGFISNLVELKANDFCTKKISKHVKYQVIDPSSEAKEGKGTKIELKDSEGKTFSSLIIGKNRDSKAKQEPNPYGFNMGADKSVYLRLPENDRVYLSNNSIDLHAAPSNWLEKELFKIKAEKISGFSYSTKDIKEVIITRDSPSSSFVVKNKGTKKQKDPIIKTLSEASDNLRIETVLTPEEAKSFELSNLYKVRTFEGMEYTFAYSDSIKEKYAQHEYKISAKYIENKSSETKKPIVEVSKDDEKSPKAPEEPKYLSKLEGEIKANVFNARHSKWVYLIADWKSKKFSKKFSELFEEVISASHILIPFEGSERSESKRTKDDAKKLAEEVLVKVNEKDADFAKLAEKYSEGPSAKDGGNLGEFGKGKMAPKFEQAAFALKVGKISTIIETKFGFHIIKRTK